MRAALKHEISVLAQPSRSPTRATADDDQTFVAQALGAKRPKSHDHPMNKTLEQIWNDFAKKLGLFIRARVADPETAEDILQDVFVKIQQRLGQLRHPAKLQSWIYLIARNAVIDYYRKRKETTEVPDTLLVESPENEDEMEALKTTFRRMLYNLPEPYRDALVLTEIEGLT